MPRLSKIGAAALAAFGFSSGAAGVTASYLVVAGGGGASIGGGGAGGYKTGTTSLALSTSYTVTVGAGGAGQGGTTADGVNGSDSVFNAVTSTGGGGGGADFPNAAGSGGSGGGAGSNTATKGFASPVGQGNDGGSSSGGTSPYPGGGGGGAGAVGNNGSASTGGSGGAGSASSITGSSVTYAGGGGAGLYLTGTGGAGGAGGGGNASGNGSGTAGTANTGGGGGGSTGSNTGGAGGSGIVIISYTGAQQFGGGVVTSVGGNTIHTFTTSGTLSPLSSLSASYLIVAGGAGSGSPGVRTGGGGAGGLLTSSVTIDTNSTYLVTVGSGGAAGAIGTNSAFSIVSTTALGGGSGGTFNNVVGVTGGSGGGGGGGSSGAAGGAGTSGQGNTGGAGSTSASSGSGGGGGGSGAVGGAASGDTGGNGGTGTASSISGSSVTYAGGGGGGGSTAGGTATGGGGAGSTSGVATAGTANTGGGGGGTGSGTNAAGGSGIVIISYAGATQSMAGGTVTIVGGNVIHTFTSSGYLTPLTLLNNSLRFRASNSAYLSRTPTQSATSTQKFTYSAWIKRGLLGNGSNYENTFTAYISGSARDSIRFDAADTISIYFNETSSAILTTNAVYRDPAAWYHIVVAVDTTQATAANRIILYVNGTQVTSFGTATYPSQNYAITGFNQSGKEQDIGRYPTNQYYFDGYMTAINVIDGQQLTPNSFGTFNSYGVWQPINYGGSYGTNGFYLPFTNTTSTTTLGYDFSPNGNNWTTNNISLTAGATYDSMTDVPTLTSATAANYAVLNPLDSTLTLINANLSWSAPSNTELGSRGTIGVSSGKWYYEYKITSATANPFSLIGWASQSQNNNSVIATGTGPSTWAYYAYDFKTYNNGTASSVYGVTGSVNDIIMVALDLDNSRIYWGRNGTWFSSGNPATQTNPAYSSVSGTLFPWIQEYNQTSSINFGQRPFSYSAPSGYVALNTYNL